jgi:sugar phosphate isomerase/epimerase
LARVVRSKGAILSALKADVGGRRLADAKALDANLLRLREAAQLASDVGAEHLVVAAGLLPVPGPQQKDAGQGEDATARATLSEAARALCEIASSSRARVCWLGGSEAPQALAEFLNSIDSGGLLQLDLNPGAYALRGLDLLAALQALGPRVALATAADYYRGGGEAPLGQGDVRWAELFVALSALPRPTHILAACGLEGDRVAMLAASYSRLKALRQNPIG